MSLPFDATLKELVQAYPHDWLAALGLPATGPVAALNVDLSTLTAAGDVVLSVGDPPELVVDLEFQSGRDPDLARRLLLYHAALHQRYGVPVHTAVVLLRRGANDAALDGGIRYETLAGQGGLTFRFEVVRVWETAADAWLAGALGLTPLAVLGALPAEVAEEAALRPVVDRLADRVKREAQPGAGPTLLVAAYVLAGARVSLEVARQLFRGITMLEESTTYQYILKLGALRHGRQLILRQGRVKFGDPDPATAARIEAIEEPDELDRLGERLLFVNNWAELFAAGS
jgi:hypothetical protein